MIDGRTTDLLLFHLELQPNLGLPSRGLSVSQKFPTLVVGGTDSRGYRNRRPSGKLLWSVRPLVESPHCTPYNGQPIPHQFGDCTHPSVGVDWVIAVMLWQETGHTLLFVPLTTGRYVRDAQSAGRPLDSPNVSTAILAYKGGTGDLDQGPFLTLSFSFLSLFFFELFSFF